VFAADTESERERNKSLGRNAPRHREMKKLAKVKPRQVFPERERERGGEECWLGCRTGDAGDKRRTRRVEASQRISINEIAAELPSSPVSSTFEKRKLRGQRKAGAIFFCPRRERSSISSTRGLRPFIAGRQQDEEEV